MANIDLWKVLVDGGLLASFIFFAYKFIRQQSPSFNPSQILELHSGLKTAIRDADEAGRTLSEQLLKRQQNLEKILFDLETVEHRVNRAITAAEERKGELEIAANRARSVADNIQIPEQVKSQNVRISLAEDMKVPVARPESEVIPEPPHFESSVSGKAHSDAAAIYAERLAAANAKKAEAEKAARPKAINLDKQVQVIKETKSPEKALSIEEVYAAAEDLLKAGKELDYVCARTRLPEEEVRMLARLLEQDNFQEDLSLEIEKDHAVESEIVVRDKDSRLGVLGGIKRQVQIV